MKIRRRRNRRAGSSSWQLDAGKINGRRWQRSYPTKDEAEKAKADLIEELRISGEKSLTLTDHDRWEFTAARTRLATVNASITEAVDFFLTHSGRAVRCVVEMGDLVTRCLAAKRDERLRDRYLVQLKSTGVAFARHVGVKRAVHEVTTDDVTAWLSANQWSAVTCNGYVTTLKTIFAFAREIGACSLNPCDAIKRRKVDASEVVFVSVVMVRALFARASEERAGVQRRDARTGKMIPLRPEDEDFRDFIPLLALGFFCGLRPEVELGKMPKSDVKIASAVAVVTSGRAKGRQRRTVDIPPNALAWLKWGMKFLTGENILPKNFAKRWRRLRSACGFAISAREDGVLWVKDAMRHTYATMHLAEHRDEAALQLLMGHRSSAMIWRHYRGLATPAEAAAFWKLRPGGKGKRLKVMA